MPMGIEYYTIKIKNFGEELSHFRLRTNAARHTFFNVCLTYTGKL